MVYLSTVRCGATGFLNLAGYLDIEDHSTEKISYHVGIMAEAGLIEMVAKSACRRYAEYSGTSAYVPTALTWWGHEFLEAVRDDTHWSKVKNVAAKTGGFVFEVVKSVAIDLLMKEAAFLL